MGTPHCLAISLLELLLTDLVKRIARIEAQRLQGIASCSAMEGRRRGDDLKITSLLEGKSLRYEQGSC